MSVERIYFTIIPQVGELNYWCCQFCAHADPDWGKSPKWMHSLPCEKARSEGTEILNVCLLDDVIRCQHFKECEPDLDGPTFNSEKGA